MWNMYSRVYYLETGIFVSLIAWESQALYMCCTSLSGIKTLVYIFTYEKEAGGYAKNFLMVWRNWPGSPSINGFCHWHTGKKYADNMRPSEKFQRFLSRRDCTTRIVLVIPML